jgi:probable biosynthetic protein (TIGR04099 family)
VSNVPALDAFRSGHHPSRPTSRELLERALDPYLLLGMPHLTPTGLSEAWLMKELGHRHWMMLARRLGMNDADFRTADGREAYASICATSMTAIGAGLGHARANDIIEIRSRLHAVSKRQYLSQHRLSIGDDQLCSAELLSAFVARSREGDNHSLARVEQRFGETQASAADSALAFTASRMRRVASDMGETEVRACRTGAAVTLTPDPGSDFNGAGLLYFARFAGLFSSALTKINIKDRVGQRQEIYFYGNLRPGESLTITMHEDPTGATLLCHMARPDGKIIATYRSW